MISHSHLVHMATKLEELQGGLSSHKVIDQVARAFLPLMITVRTFCKAPLDFKGTSDYYWTLSACFIPPSEFLMTLIKGTEGKPPSTDPISSLFYTHDDKLIRSV